MKNISVEYKDISELTLYKNNPRKNATAINAVAKSIKEFKNKKIIKKLGEADVGEDIQKADN